MSNPLICILRDIEPPYIVTNNTQILTLSIYLCFSTPCLSHHCSLSPLQPNCSTLMPVNNVRYKIDNTKFSHKLLWIDFKLLLGINMYYHYTKTPLNTWTIMSQKTQGFSISHRSNFRNWIFDMWFDIWMSLFHHPKMYYPELHLALVLLFYFCVYLNSSLNNGFLF